MANFREAFDLLVELLQFQVEQFAPYDPPRNGLAMQERSGGEAEIVEEIAEPSREPDVPDFLTHLGEAQLDRDAAARLSLGSPAALRSATRRKESVRRGISST